MGMPISLDFFRLFKKLAKENNLIFLHHPYPLGFLAYYLFGRGRKLVVWYHSDIIRQKISGFLFSPILKAVLKKSQKIFVSNPNLVKNSKVLQGFQKKCVVVPFGVGRKFFEENENIGSETQLIRKKFGEPLILSVGRLAYYKGFSYLIKASREVPAKFLVIGEGKLKKKLDNLINKYQLRNKFSIVPSVKDLIPYYHACDVFVLPSIQPTETFGIVLLEAMACAKPVISTELHTGTSFINQDKRTGLVIEPRNAEALACAINNLINDADLKKSFSQNARDRARQFTLEIFLAQISQELGF